MSNRVELEGYLYILSYEIDAYDAEDLCLNEDISKVAYENLDYKSRKYLEYVHYPKYQPQDAPRKDLENPVGLTEILKEKLALEPAEINRDYDTNTYTFQPKAKRVRITIEEIVD